MDADQIEEGTTGLRIADVWVKQWAEAGIEVVFGIPGVHNMALFDALRRDGRIRVVVPRHELGAAYMADGYFRATGRYAVLLTITGPGLTNALTGIAEADAESSGMIVVSTEVASSDVGRGRGTLHELPDQRSLVQGLVKVYGAVRSAGEATEVMREILESRGRGRPAPMYVEIPYDLLDARVEESEGGSDARLLSGGGGVVRRFGTPPDVPVWKATGGENGWLREVVSRIQRWCRPLVVVGSEAPDAAPLIRQLVARWGVPALTTVTAKGIIPGDDPWFAGTTWTPGLEDARLVEESDGILAVGTRWSARGWFGGVRPDKEVVLVTESPGDVRRDGRLTAVVAGAPGEVLKQILEAVPWESAASRGGGQAERAHRARTAAARRASEVEEDLVQWMQAVRHALPGDAVLAVDSTLVGIAMARYFPVLRPRTFMYPMYFGSLGFAVPAALGAALAGVGQAVAVTGDGSMMFTLQELATAAQVGADLLILLFNNRAYGSVRHNQRKAYGEEAYVDLPGPDWAKLSAAFGCEYQRVAWKDLPAALWKAFPLRGCALWEIDDAPVDWY